VRSGQGVLKELGDTLDAGQAGLIVVYETNLADQVAATSRQPTASSPRPPTWPPTNSRRI
jgi:hypothetical protein